MRPDPFEGNYITVGSNMAEDGKNQITSVQPEIQTELNQEIKILQLRPNQLRKSLRQKHLTFLHKVV